MEYVLPDEDQRPPHRLILYQIENKVIHELEILTSHPIKTLQLQTNVVPNVNHALEGLFENLYIYLIELVVDLLIREYEEAEMPLYILQQGLHDKDFMLQYFYLLNKIKNPHVKHILVELRIRSCFGNKGDDCFIHYFSQIL